MARMKKAREITDELARRLMTGTSRLPTSTLARMGRNALTGLRGARLLRGKKLVDEVTDIDQGAGVSMRKLLFEQRRALRITLPGEFLLLLRIRLGLMAVLSRMGARANWYRLEQSYVAAPSP
jgi:hypothetical protein